ncbi:hypothetical protein EJB05_47684, partial [Eragrostis curvula]
MAQAAAGAEALGFGREGESNNGGGLTCTPQVPDSLQPAVGMEFDDVLSAEKFYKDYAHEAGFSVRIGQHTMVDGVVMWKRFYCSREGFRDESKKKVEAPSKMVCKQQKKRKYVQKFTRVGCEAMMAIKRTTENKFRIEIFQLVHNYHGTLRTMIKTRDAQMFVDNLAKKNSINSGFYFDYVVDEEVEEQREKELMEDNASLHSEPVLQTGWPIEKHGSQVLTYTIFLEFQKEVLAARDHCIVDSMKEEGNLKIWTITDHSPKLNELPSHYVLKRWTKYCKREVVYDADGNLLEEKKRTTMDTEVKKVASDMRKEMEDIFQRAGSSVDTMHIVKTKFQKFVDEVKQELPANQQSRVEEIEGFIGCSVPSQISILPPNELHSKGRVKRIRGPYDKGGSDKKKEEAKKKKNERIPRLCGSCKELVLHDKRSEYIEPITE